MLISVLAVVLGIMLLVWSADRFVVGAAATAREFGVPPLVIGMVVIGFGTSAPEMLVSVLAAASGNAGIALGNAYGSNISNIAMIIGLTAILSPIAVHSRVIKVELPVLLVVTLVAAYQVLDGMISRLDAIVLLVIFATLMTWTVVQGMRRKDDSLAEDVEAELLVEPLPFKLAIMWLIVGLGFLMLSSRVLVWGAVNIATALGVSDILIGLTVVAIGTSLPELASSIAATRRGEHDIALGNVVGSNLFNTLAVVGLAGVIRPIECEPLVIVRDVPVMIALTVVLLIFGIGIRGAGRINRLEGFILFASYIAYMAYLIVTNVPNVLPAG